MTGIHQYILITLTTINPIHANAVLLHPMVTLAKTGWWKIFMSLILIKNYNKFILTATTSVCNAPIIALILLNFFCFLQPCASNLFSTFSCALLFRVASSNVHAFRTSFKANTSPRISRMYSAFTKSFLAQKAVRASAFDFSPNWMLFFNSTIIHAKYLWTSLFWAS